MADKKLTSKSVPEKDDYINNSFTILDTPNDNFILTCKQVKCHEKVAISLINSNTLVMSNAQKHILQRCWLFSSSNSISTPSYFQETPRPTKVSSSDSNVIVIDDRLLIPTQVNDTDFSINSKYFDNKSQIFGDNQLDDQQSTSSKRPIIEAEMHHPAINIKQDPPTANDDIATSLLLKRTFLSIILMITHLIQKEGRPFHMTI